MMLPRTIERPSLAAADYLRACAAALAIMLAAATVAYAQSAPKNAPAPPPPTVSSAPPNALQGFAQNRDKPIRIDAERLEVRDKQKVATFFGDAKADVKVVQGDVTIRSKILVVFYDQDDAAKSAAEKSAAEKSADKSAKAASPGPGGGRSQIRRLEAKGNVIVTQKDQTVTGELGVFDMKTNVATVSGGVVMTQCENVVRGERLIVDMTTGVSKVESSGGRVQSTLVQSQPGAGCGGSAAPAPAPKR
jgi:lipopolysaccharide export system protein LptA